MARVPSTSGGGRPIPKCLLNRPSGSFCDNIETKTRQKQTGKTFSFVLRRCLRQAAELAMRRSVRVESTCLGAVAIKRCTNAMTVNTHGCWFISVKLDARSLCIKRRIISGYLVIFVKQQYQGDISETDRLYVY